MPTVAIDLDRSRRLRAAGLRVTSPRLAVLTLLEERPGHHLVGEVALLARQRLGSLSVQAAYDVLDALAGAGLARRLELAGSATRFEARAGDNHHHLVCRTCGRISDVGCANQQAPCLTPSDPDGYVIDQAEVTYWGLCPACATQSEDQ